MTLALQALLALAYTVLAHLPNAALSRALERWASTV